MNDQVDRKDEELDVPPFLVREPKEKEQEQE